MFVFHYMLSLIEGNFLLRIISVRGNLPAMVVFYQNSSFINGHLIKGHLSSKVNFHHRSSYIKGHLSSKVIFHQRFSCIKGHLSSKVTCHTRQCCQTGHSYLTIVVNTTIWPKWLYFGHIFWPKVVFL